MRDPEPPKLWLIQILELMVVVLLLMSTPTKTEAEILPPIDYKTPWIHELGFCESGNRPEIKHLDSNGKFSYGELQFQMDTWLSYGKPFGSTPENISSSTLQYKVAQSMLDKGEFWHWKTCVKKTEAKLGTYPHAKNNQI